MTTNELPQEDDSAVKAEVTVMGAEASSQKENKNIQPIQNEAVSAGTMMVPDIMDSASQKEIYEIAKSSREVQGKLNNPGVTKESFTPDVQQATNSANYKQISNKLEQPSSLGCGLNVLPYSREDGIRKMQVSEWILESTEATAATRRLATQSGELQWHRILRGAVWIHDCTIQQACIKLKAASLETLDHWEKTALVMLHAVDFDVQQWEEMQKEQAQIRNVDFNDISPELKQHSEGPAIDVRCSKLKAVSAECWAGVAHMGEMLKRLGLPLDAASELLDAERELLKQNNPEAEITGDFELKEWQKWPERLKKKNQCIRILVGGIPCVTLSISGKRQEEKDERTKCFNDTIEMAEFLKVWQFLGENLWELLDRDWKHGIFAEFCRKAKKAKFYLLASCKRVHSQWGGRSQRKRFFFWLESTMFMMVLPPVTLKDEPDQPCISKKIKDILEKVEDVPSEYWLPGVWKPERRKKIEGRAWLAGYMHIKDDVVRTGALVTIKDREEVWLVMACKQPFSLSSKISKHAQLGSCTFLYDDRVQPEYVYGKGEDVLTVEEQWIPCYDIDSVTITLRSFATPMAYWMAIHDIRKGKGCCRSLMGIECWRIPELDESSAKWWLQNGADDYYLGRAAGKSLPASMTESIMVAQVERLRLEEQQVELQEAWGMPVMHIDAPAIRGSVCKVFLVIITFKQGQPQFLLPQDSQWMLGRCFEGNQARKATISITQGWTEQIFCGRDKVCELVSDLTQDTVRSQIVMCARNVHNHEVLPVEWTDRQTLRGTVREWVCLQAAAKAATLCFGKTGVGGSVLKGTCFGTVLPALLVPRRPRDTVSKLHRHQSAGLLQIENVEKEEWVFSTGAMIGQPVDAVFLESLQLEESNKSRGTVDSGDGLRWSVHTVALDRAEKRKRCEARQLDAALNLDVNDWKRVVAEQQRYGEELRKAITDAAELQGDEEIKTKLNAWADRVSSHDHSEIPDGVRSAIQKWRHWEFWNQPFPRRCEQAIPETKWLPNKPNRPYQRRYIKCISEFFTEAGWQKVVDVLKGVLKDLKAYADSGCQAERSFNTVLAFGPDQFQDWVGAADGNEWDCRKLKTHGYVETMDFQAPNNTHLNVDWLLEVLPDWPDQELMSMLKHGVQYKAPLSWQFVIFPHLVSFKNGVEKIQKEIKKLVEKGWYEIFDHIPFVPMRNIPRGCVARSREPDRPRPTADAGQPRKETVDSQGNPVLPINEACILDDLKEEDSPAQEGWQQRLHDQKQRLKWQNLVSTKWPKEVKPTLACVMQMMVVLLAAAKYLGQPVFLMSADSANYFNQMRLAPSEYARCVTLLRDAKTNTMEFVAEYCMSFGVRPASNIAQRFAYAIVALVTKIFAAEEEEFVRDSTCPKLRKWWAVRKKLSAVTGFPEAALFFGVQYTDDPAWVIVGIERTVRFITCWTKIMNRLGLIMAIAEKQQLGTAIIWSGIICFAAGAMVVPTAKRVRAIEDLRKFIRGELTVGNLTKLNGLLEHIRSAQRLDRSTMYGLRLHLQSGYEADRGPETKIQPLPISTETATAWIQRLALGCATSILAVLPGSIEIPYTASTLITSSDACKDEDGICGMGGVFEAYWWHWTCDARMKKLSMPVLEMLAFIVNLIVMKELLRPFVVAEQLILAFVDAQAAVHILQNEKVKSRAMLELYSRIRAAETFLLMRDSLAVGQVYSEGNTVADLASRNMEAELLLYFQQLGLRPEKKIIPVEAEELVESLLVSLGM